MMLGGGNPNGGNPVVSVVRREDADDFESSISIAIGELRNLQAAVRTGSPIRNKAISANEQMKKVQEKIGSAIKNRGA